MVTSYFKKRFLKKNDEIKEFKKIANFPKNALIELTNGCNHACIFCKNSHQKRRPSYLSIDLYTKFIKQAVILGLEEIGLYATGEPFMTKNIEEFIKIAKTNGVKRIYITSNGALATLDKVKKCFENGLNSIKFSINAGNREDYKIIHGYDDFTKVRKNVEDIYKWKEKNNLDIQLLGSCVLVPTKPHTQKEHNRIFKDFFEDILYVSSSSQGGQKFDIPLDENGLAAIFHSQPIINEKDIKPCQMLWNRLHLTAEGYLTACCVDYDLNLVFSDINENSLKDSWNNEIIQNLRQKHINSNLDGTVCKQCLTNKKSTYTPIKEVKSKDFKKIDFIKNEKLLINRILESEK